MAEESPAEESPKARPRIRKTAPTIRERVEIAQAEAEKKSRPGRVKPLLTKAKAPLKKIKPPSVKLPGPIALVVAKIGRVLRWLAPRYFVNAWREVRQVTWPSRRETWRLTGAVFIFAIVFGALVYGVDTGLDALFKKVILKE
ncbi:MAG: preprotein translocase subunit SecE [Candidatus Saccharimonadales bacterium]